MIETVTGRRMRLPSWFTPGALGLALLLAVAATTGCGGGGGKGGGAPTSITVSPTSLELTGYVTGGVTVTRRLQVHFQGDGLVVGTAKGAPDASAWLDASIEMTGPQDATVTVYATPYVPRGTYSTVLRVVTGHEDGSALKWQDIPLTFRVVTGLQLQSQSLAFAAGEGETPTAQELLLTSDVADDRWAVTGVTDMTGPGPVDWLVLPLPMLGAFSGGQARVPVSVKPKLPGSYRAQVWIGDSLGTTRGFFEITYTVSPRLGVTPSLAATVTEAATLARLDLPIDLHPLAAPDAATWTLASDQPWVTVSPASGDLSGDVRITARLQPDALWGLPNGRHTATLALRFSAGGPLARDLPVTLDLALAPALVAPPRADALATGLITAGDLVRELSIGTNVGEAFAPHAGWTVTASPPLAASGQGGATGGTVTAALSTAGMPAADGTYGGSMRVTPADPRIASVDVPVYWQVQAATVTGVFPHATFAGQAGEVVVRGTGFGAGPTLPVDFGGTVVTARVIGPTELRALAPVQADPGSVAVSVPNAAPFQRAPGEQLVLGAPGYTSYRAALPSGASWSALQTDPERRAVLVTGGRANGFRRFAFSGGAWSEDGFSMPDVQAVGVSADGKELVAAASDFSFSASLGAWALDPVTLAVRRSQSTPASYSIYGAVASFNDGRTLLVNTEQWTRANWYPGLAAAPSPGNWGPSILLTRDRSRLFSIGANGSGCTTFDAGAAAFVGRPCNAYFTPASTSGDGKRVVAAGIVYDRDLAALGSIAVPANRNVQVAAVAPDGRAAYVAVMNPTETGWTWLTVDLTAASGPYAVASLALPVTIPWEELPRALAISEDGGTLFLLTQSWLGNQSVPDFWFYAIPLG